MQEMPRSVSMTRTRELRSRMTGKLSRPVLKAGRKEQSFLPSDQIATLQQDRILSKRTQMQKQSTKCQNINEKIGLRVQRAGLIEKGNRYKKRGRVMHRN